MQLEDYFDFLAPDDIRIKGTRVGTLEYSLRVYSSEANPRGNCPEVSHCDFGAGLPSTAIHPHSAYAVDGAFWSLMVRWALPFNGGSVVSLFAQAGSLLENL